MGVEFISTKLLKISLLSCFVILLLLVFHQRFIVRSYMVLCNNGGKLEVYMHYDHLDIIGTPYNIKNVLGCISKGMPYYDRTIEHAINYHPDVDSALVERYTILNYVQPSEIVYYDTNAMVLKKNKTDLIIRTSLNLSKLLSIIASFKPNVIIIPNELSNNVFRSIEKENVQVVYVSNIRRISF